jgi:hypothetical protein
MAGCTAKKSHIIMVKESEVTTFISFVVEFQSSTSETEWKMAKWNFELRNGKFVTL